MNGTGISGTMFQLKAKSMANNMPPEVVESFTGCSYVDPFFAALKILVLRKRIKIAQWLRIPQEFENQIKDDDQNEEEE